MDSASPPPPPPDPSDLTAPARIRDAAMDLFGDEGFDRTTLRAVADRAGVSAPLVIHHFGSKEGLRRACDDHLLAWFRSEKGRVFAGGALPTRSRYLAEHPELRRLYGYLRRTFVSGGPVADELFDRFVDEVRAYLDVGERAGLLRPCDDPEARAVVTSAFGLGVMVVDSHIARHLGGGADLMDDESMKRYIAFTNDCYTRGLLTRPITFAPEDGADEEER